MGQSIIQRINKHSLIILFLIFYFGVAAYKFIAHPTPFYDWDEAIYAQVGREMVQKKSLVPLWQGRNWLDKPPLTPLVYGIVESVTPLSPEISTRMFTLLLSVAVLALTYVFYYRLTKNKIIPLLTVIITAFAPIFLQRSQVLNVDVFLFLGWIGYLVFYNNFWLSFFFLAIGVLSKSLLGFYPVIGMLIILTIQLYSKQINKKSYKKQVLAMLLQIGILSLWYFVMLITFKFAFIKNQFLEAMLKRVTTSIESHFGSRTYYIEMLFDQLKLFAVLSIVGTILLLKDLWSQKKWQPFILSLFFLPWFLFLNLTKTKISWYLYPVLAQFAFLGTYPLQLIKKKKLISYFIFSLLIAFILYQNFGQATFFNTHYSTFDQYYDLAIFVNKNCKQIEMLVDPQSRITHDTLQKMNLLISTSEWWGNHPSIVYYSGKKVDFIYDTKVMPLLIEKATDGTCFVTNEEDVNSMKLYRLLRQVKKFKEIGLLVK